MNSQSATNVDIPNSQNSSKFIRNNPNLSNRRSRSRLRQTSGERSLIAERRLSQAAEKARRYKERIRTNRDVYSQSFENVDIPNTQNSSKFIGNNPNLSNPNNQI